MTPDEIAKELAELHNQLIDLFTHLHERAEADSPRQLLSQLLELETTTGQTVIFQSGQNEDHYHPVSSHPLAPAPRRRYHRALLKKADQTPGGPERRGRSAAPETTR